MMARATTVAAYLAAVLCYPGGFDIGLMVLPLLVGWGVYRATKWIAA